MNVAPDSGLSGIPDVEPISDATLPTSLGERFGNLERSVTSTIAALPRVLRLVWRASAPVTLTLFAVTTVSGIVPAASAYVSKLLINAAVQGILIHNAHLKDQEQFTFGPWRTPVLSAVEGIVFIAILQLLLSAITAALNTVRSIMQQLLQNAVSMRLQLMVMEKAASLDLDFYEEPNSYDLLRRVQMDSINRPVMMISTVFGLIQTLLTFGSMIALLIAVSPLLALLALVSPVPSFLADTRYAWRGYNISAWGSRLLRRMNYLAILVTTDGYAKEVKLFSLGNYFVERYRLLADAYYGSQRPQIVRRHIAGFAWGNVSTLANSLTYLYVALQAIAGRLTLGDLSLYTSAAQSLQSSSQGILGGSASMYEHNLYLNNLFELMAMKPSMHVPAMPVKVLSPLRGEIRFENVTFVYPGATKEALVDVSFTVGAGETLAVVGRNGAGKTTLFKLICRLYDPTVGRVLIDEVDVRDIDPNQLRQQISAMFQDYVCYQATAAENIGIGDVARISNLGAITRASGLAGAHDLISNMPEGYGTALGKWFDAGVNLSGGEWQKVALARAFMRDARILLLDEPTSALDAEAEYELLERLTSLTVGRTAVYISHRFSTVRRADRIAFLERGRLLEQGTHKELMELNGRYAHLFRMQASAYTEGSLGSAPVRLSESKS